MRSQTPLVALVALGTALLGAGCSASADDQPVQAPTAAPTVTSAAPTAPTETTEGAEDESLKPGEVHAFTAPDGEKVSVTLIQYKRDGENEGIQVRTCNKGDIPFDGSILPWAISYSGGEELSQNTVIGGGLLEPAFAETEIKPGKCRKGWINFVRPGSGQPDGAEYNVDGVTSARWEW